MDSVSKAKVSIDWGALTLAERMLIAAIAERGASFVAAFKREHPDLTILDPDRHLLEMDVSVVHLRVGLDLVSFLNAPDDYFIQDFVAIQRHINRPLCSFPGGVRLRFALQKSLF
jgi:hypothetical protein